MFIIFNTSASLQRSLHNLKNLAGPDSKCDVLDWRLAHVLFSKINSFRFNSDHMELISHLVWYKCFDLIVADFQTAEKTKSCFDVKSPIFSFVPPFLFI